MQDQLDEVDGSARRGLAAAGPALEQWLEQLDLPGEGSAGRDSGAAAPGSGNPWTAVTRAVLVIPPSQEPAFVVVQAELRLDRL